MIVLAVIAYSLLILYSMQIGVTFAKLLSGEFYEKKEFWLNLIPAYPFYEEYKDLH